MLSSFRAEVGLTWLSVRCLSSYLIFSASLSDPAGRGLAYRVEFRRARRAHGLVRRQTFQKIGAHTGLSEMDRERNWLAREISSEFGSELI